MAATPACTTSSGDDDDDDSSGSTGERCVSFCDDAQSADCVNFEHGACVGSCTELSDLQKETTECTPEFEALVACFDRLATVCDAVSLDPDTGKLLACAPENADLSNCLGDYCSEHPTADICS